MVNDLNLPYVRDIYKSLLGLILVLDVLIKHGLHPLGHLHNGQLKLLVDDVILQKHRSRITNMKKNKQIYCFLPREETRIKKKKTSAQTHQLTANLSLYELSYHMSTVSNGKQYKTIEEHINQKKKLTILKP